MLPRLDPKAESGSQSVIDAMDRRVDVQQVRTMIRATRAAGMEAGTFLMLGYRETEADMEETIRHLKDASHRLYHHLSLPDQRHPLYGAKRRILPSCSGLGSFNRPGY